MIIVSQLSSTVMNCLTLALSAGSYFDISISTSINISIRKIRKTCVNRGYISISTSISIRKWKSSIPCAYTYACAYAYVTPVRTCFSYFSYACAYAYVTPVRTCFSYFSYPCTYAYVKV